MTDPPSRRTENGQKLVLVDPLDRKLTQEDRQALSLEEFRAMESELAKESASGLAAALAWPEITPETMEPPDEWVQQLGHKKAEQKLRIAKAAWMPTKDAPVGLKLLQNVYLGIRRVQAADNMAGGGINIAPVILVQAPEQYPVVEVESK